VVAVESQNVAGSLMSVSGYEPSKLVMSAQDRFRPESRLTRAVTQRRQADASRRLLGPGVVVQG
jgi:hypothetical protein